MHKYWGLIVSVCLTVVVTGCGSTTLARPSASHPRQCPTGTVSLNENGTIHCLATHAVADPAVTPTVTDAPTGVRVQWTDGASLSRATVFYQSNGGALQSQTIPDGGILTGINLGALVAVDRIQGANGSVAWTASTHAPQIEYGAVAKWGTVADVPRRPRECQITVSYDKPIPNQTPSQNFAQYHVRAFDSNIPDAHVLRVWTVQGHLRLLVRFTTPGWGAPIIVHMPNTAVHTKTGAPVYSNVDAY